MQAGDEITLRAYKSDGTCYRWHTSHVEEMQPNCVVIVGGPGRRIHQPDGGFVAKHTMRSYLWLDRPISLLELFDENGTLIELYVNINSPVIVTEDEVSYTDYELDVVWKPGLATMVVDEDEFEAAIVEYGYSDEFQKQCYQAALDAVALVEKWSPGEMPDTAQIFVNDDDCGERKMNLSEFESSMTQSDPPADLPNALNALWYAGKGKWDKAHDTCQAEEGQPESDWVHAYLHRDEGDLPNAGYWYRRAGREMPQNSLKDEWTAMVTELLAG